MRLAPTSPLLLAARVACCALALGLGAAPVAEAQSSRALDVQLFTPPAATGSTFGIDSPEVPRHLGAQFGLAATYAHAPLTREGTGGTEPVIEHLAQADVLAALGLFEWLEFGLAVPVSALDAAVDAEAPGLQRAWTLGAADLRLSMKLPLLRGDLAVSARLVVGVPTGDSANFRGAGYWTLLPELVASWDLGPARVAAELGYRLRQRRAVGDLEQDDELQVALGAAIPVTPEVSLIVDSQARIGAGGRSLRANEVPWDANAGARLRLFEGGHLEAAVGTAILAGYGAPDVRGLLTFRYATERAPCEGGPEDFDGFEDGDFCADPDNDADGLPDAVDRCANDAEDADGFADDDGCPDPDNDADGVADASDSCPRASEDVDDFRDEDGCPEPDNDEDGLEDGRDRCPMEPEDADQFQDEDGCPEPGPRALAVTVTDTRILISERVYFEFDTDTIRSVSTPLLDQVAAAVLQLDAALRVRVDGYTDDAGSPDYNLDLSFRRARAVVEYLAGRGVARERLEFRGYGSLHPVAPNDSQEGRALNRRVEFTILHPTDAPAEPSPRPRRRTSR